MNRTAKFVLALAVMISIGWAVLGSTDRGELLAGPPDPPPALPIPADLYNLDLSLDTTAVYTDRKRAWFGWDTASQEVRIKRASRTSLSAAWETRQDEIRAPFLLTGVAAPCEESTKELDTFFVAGTYESNGHSTIEKWAIRYESDIQVQRTVLYSGSTLGFLRSIAVDHRRRTMLVLTTEDEVYRLRLGDGLRADPVKIYDTVRLPEIAGSKGLSYGDHAIEGPKWILHAPARHHAIFLNDPDDDGAIDSTTRLTATDWKAGGFSSESAWNEPCVD